MRSWASALALLVACGSPARPATEPPKPVAARKLPPPPPCKTIVPHCDHPIDDPAVFSLVRRRCWGCHATDGIAGHDFPDLTALGVAPVSYMIGSCQMPPDGAPLPDSDRQRLVDWSSCPH